MVNILNTFLIGIGIGSIFLGIEGISKGYITGIFNVFAGFFLIYLVLEDRRKTKKEIKKGEKL